MSEKVMRAVTMNEASLRRPQTDFGHLLPYSVSSLDTLTRSGPADKCKQLIQQEPQLHGIEGGIASHSPFSTVTAEVGAALAAGLNTPVPLPSATGYELKGVCSKGMLSTTFSQMAHSAQLQPACVQPVGGPPHGVKAVCGKRTQMEDAFSVQTNFFDLPAASTDVAGNKLPPRIAAQIEQVLTSAMYTLPSSMLSSSTHFPGMLNLGSDSSASDMLHFFGVYDGHGGYEAANHCATRLHHHLSEALSQFSVGLVEPAAMVFNETACQSVCVCMAPETEASTIPSPFQSMAAKSDFSLAKDGSGSDDSTQTEVPAALGDTSNGSVSNASTMEYKPADNMSAFLEEALRKAFLKTDAEFAADDSASITGSTAVVALVGKKNFWIANCGDSRAVLCRAGKAVQLTDDHKPERQDEAERVEKAGGHVLYWNGHRVMGILAMSRAIGDHGLRPYIIPEPEISVVARSKDDDFLLLASDGLWDVMSNQETADLASRCLNRACEKGAGRKAAVRIAASVLTKAAIDRGSKDNVTVVIVDLKPPEVAKAGQLKTVATAPVPVAEALPAIPSCLSPGGPPAMEIGD